ncbi:MAG TPA: response regulator [Ktedonobacterales bacterium]
MADGLKVTTVLIVDDDEGIRETLRFMLEDAGYGVIEAKNGIEALDVLRASQQPMVVLLDVKMPALNGEQVLEAVVKDPHGLHRHAYVLVTASPQAITPRMMELIAQLAIPFVPKPFGMDQLLNTIERAVSRLG